MNRRQIGYLCVALCLLAAGGTHASTTYSSQTEASVDIVSQQAGIVGLEQVTTNHNATTGTTDISLTVTNQRAVRIPPLNVRIGDRSASTGPLAPGESETIRFSSVRCSETIQSETTMDELRLKITTPITCS